MPHSAIFLMPRTSRHSDQKKDALQKTVPVVTQNLEDGRLAARVERALRATGYASLRSVAVSANAGVVIILGRVPSYFLKQIAQATALAVPGLQQIQNRLDVVSPKQHCRDEGRAKLMHSFHMKEISR